MSIGDLLEVPTSPPPATLSAAAEACARPGAAAATPVATLSRFGELMVSFASVEFSGRRRKLKMWLSQLKYAIQKQEVELRKTPKTAFLSIF